MTASDDAMAAFGASRGEQPGTAPLPGQLAQPHGPAIVSDPLYGDIRVAWWAAALLRTPPFQRLAGISLSDVPGEWLFRRAFPTRFDHSIGVYYLARLARPRDRALQAAALAHDLGHGPFSHLSESLMRDTSGVGHEERSAQALKDVRASLAPTIRRQLAWLDWEEVGDLVRGGGANGRGALLNGSLDYDNIDNVARFLLASGLASPGYDPRLLARGLRLSSDDDEEAASGSAAHLLPDVERYALAWQASRATLYDYLHAQHTNLAAHAMLSKAIDLASALQLLPTNFLWLNDAEAFNALATAPHDGIRSLVENARDGAAYRCVWEADASPVSSQLLGSLLARQERLALEHQLAAEAGFAEHEVILELVTSAARRALPPIHAGDKSSVGSRPASGAPAEQTLHLFAAPGAPTDYIRRLQHAALRRLGAHGVNTRGALTSATWEVR